MIDKPATGITALIYDSGEQIEPVFNRLVAQWRAQGLRLSGFLQHDRARPDRARCDMLLEDLASGEMFSISQDRGADARGCRLNHDSMARACAVCAASLESRPDALILNKFGKTEAEGEGFRTVIAQALDWEIAIVIGVPRRNLQAWRDFAGTLAREIDLAAQGAAVELIA